MLSTEPDADFTFPKQTSSLGAREIGAASTLREVNYKQPIATIPESLLTFEKLFNFQFSSSDELGYCMSDFFHQCDYTTGTSVISRVVLQ